jgi:hypothetical protein
MCLNLRAKLFSDVFTKVFYMRLLLFGMLLNVLLFSSSDAQVETFSASLYFFKKRPFPNSHFIKGEMFVSDNEIRFVPAKLKMLVQEITINCSTVQSIKPVNDLGFIPNKLRITLNDGTRYTFFARHRNKRLACLCK